ncbi:MAG: hypothetical protein JSW61_05315 [Candidatus Thorarchaeota archaeon]|nr:MAG: hypothetical protein JSW61_05315 [Candidatus Thorarchaeota archaeon]
MMSVMFWTTPDEVIRREIESVRARRMILDQLEGGPKTGSELRESIRKDMAAQAARKGGRRFKPDKIKVTDPKLYFNTKHLEDIGIVMSQKESQQRVFSLAPKAVHPVRRVIGVTRPNLLLTSMARPEDQRPFVAWVSSERRFRAKAVKIFVEAERFSRGVSRNLEKFVPEGSRTRWKADWYDLPIEVAGDNESGVRGDLIATYDEIEEAVKEDVGEFDIVVDLSRGPPTINIALMLVAMEYSLMAIHASAYEGEKTDLTQILPRGE